MAIKLLLVEDDAGDRAGFEASVARFNHERGASFSVVSCGSLDEAMRTLDNSFDCAVVDMKLGALGGEGNLILEGLQKANIRMPVVILTGTPDVVDQGPVHVDIRKKGETDHQEILESFRLVHASGLTKVMGGRGLFEEFLGKVFRQNILAQVEAWKRYGGLDPQKSEKALMRHVLNHLISMVDMDEENCVPEEFYISPFLGATVRTGCVVVEKSSGSRFAVLTPLCDLTARIGGDVNARKVMLCRIATLQEAEAELPTSKQNAEGRKNLKSNLEKNGKGSYHYLPRTDFFDGGFLDFEAVLSVPKTEFTDRFGAPILQISPAFTKDIVARFAAYFGRQGQPALSHS